MPKDYVALVIILIKLFAFQCCKNEIGNQYELTETQRSVIPYVNNDKISFLSNTGLEFSLNVKVSQEFISIGYCFNDEYETKTATLTSIYPKLDIGYVTKAFSNTDDEDFIYKLSISANGKIFYTDCDFGRYTRYDFTDTTFFGRQFHDALIFINCWDNTNTGDQSAVYFDKIVLTKEHGIELITFTNEDYFELVK